VLAWPGSAPRSRRPKCRDHGRAGDDGGSRGRARARDAVIKDQFMIMEHRAGDCIAALARPGNPAVACTAATVPHLARRPGRPGLRRVTPPVPQGRSCGGGLEVPGYSVGGPLWWQPGRGLRRRWLVVAVLAAITRHRRCTWPRWAQQKRPTDAVTRAGTDPAGTDPAGTDPAGTDADAGRAPSRGPTRARAARAGVAPPRTRPPDTAANPDPDPLAPAPRTGEGGLRQTPRDSAGRAPR
jgi:hypothetical protein